MYGFLADLLVAVHVGYVAYVLVGEVLILVGWAFGRRWVRNLRFRTTHLLAISIVMFEKMIGVRCPSTLWEEWLRVRAGQQVTGETFVGRLLHALLFYEDTPQWVFPAIHATVGTIVLGTFLLCRPHGICRKVRASRPG